MIDHPSVYSDEIRMAMKEHYCCECGRTIRIGHEYQLFKGCWDGKWETYKTCKPCYDLRQDIFDECRADLDDGIEFGGLQEWAKEYGYDWPPVEDA